MNFSRCKIKMVYSIWMDFIYIFIFFSSSCIILLFLHGKESVNDTRKIQFFLRDILKLLHYLGKIAECWYKIGFYTKYECNLTWLKVNWSKCYIDLVYLRLPIIFVICTGRLKVTFLMLQTNEITHRHWFVFNNSSYLMRMKKTFQNLYQ